ncbi:MAG: glycoside hydrolase family 99-like domain-containing protein [Anaerolineae bacterium]|nr:glycoside hydrolase family 99-like domain-containing protein [Anaerolineae bacterium]
MQKKAFVAVYYFPNYHVDPRNEVVHGPGWTEWELVKQAVPRWSGHAQPRIPLWGYTDEADPAQMAQKIDAAAEHGIDGFLFDWYWYDDGPYLQGGLDDGFLAAENNHRLKFALMWANHNWIDIHPARWQGNPALLYPGAVTEDTFEAMTDTIIARYFHYPSYWLLDGSPYFSIYDLGTLVHSFGGGERAAGLLRRFREKVIAAGFPDLHLNAVVWGGTNWADFVPAQADALETAALSVKALGFDSVTSYVWIHHVPLTQFPETPYAAVQQEYCAYRRKASQVFGQAGLSYHPNVTMGWDASARTQPTEPHANLGYPYMPAMSGNTPAAFQQAVEDTVAFLENIAPDQPIFTVNAWNEWTEGSYLEPDTIHGMGYLDALLNGLRTGK